MLERFRGPASWNDKPLKHLSAKATCTSIQRNCLAAKLVDFVIASLLELIDDSESQNTCRIAILGCSRSVLDLWRGAGERVSRCFV